MSGGEAGALAYPAELNPALVEILGKPNFVCGPIAHLFRDAGMWPDLPRKAEDEQARVLDWMLRLYLKHGERWKEIGQLEITAAHEILKRRQPAAEGAA